MADGHVAFHREEDDGEDGGIGGHLSTQALDDAERFAEYVRLVWGPEPVQLDGQAGDEQEKVRDRHAEEIVVGRRVHVPVVDDDDAGHRVADGAQEEGDDVQDRHRDDGVDALRGGVVGVADVHVGETVVCDDERVVHGGHVSRRLRRVGGTRRTKVCEAEEHQIE